MTGADRAITRAKTVTQLAGGRGGHVQIGGDVGEPAMT